MFRTLRNFSFNKKKVLVRIDIDVPLDEKGSIADDYRLKKALPTLNYLKENGAEKIILIGHIGRPKGKIVDSLKVDPVADRLSGLLGEKVLKLDDCVGIDIPNGYRFVLLENLRFHKEEEENDDGFAKSLAGLADIFVLESFAVSHRDAASIVGVQKYIPSCAGLQFEKEIGALDLAHAKKPVVTLLGAAKISDKIKLVSKLLEKTDYLLLGGGIVFTFYKSEGLEIGKSLLDKESIPLAKELLKNKKIILPKDIVVANEISDKAASFTVRADEIPPEMVGLDIGWHTIEEYKKILSNAKTIIWNGPMGKFEIEAFGKASKEIAEYITTLDAFSIVGGGDTASAIRSFGLEEKFTHVSTGGGASLELLQGEELPGVKALEENMKKFE